MELKEGGRTVHFMFMVDELRKLWCEIRVLMLWSVMLLIADALCHLEKEDAVLIPFASSLVTIY